MSCCECCCQAQDGECCGEPGSKTCCKDDRVCCNKVCCPPEEYCCKEVICCPNGQACCGTPEAAECCDEGATCCKGLICCDEGEVCCGTELNPVCCPPGQCCYDGVCEPCDCESDEDCGEDECCLAGICGPCDECANNGDCEYCREVAISTPGDAAFEEACAAAGGQLAEDEAGGVVQCIIYYDVPVGGCESITPQLPFGVVVEWPGYCCDGECLPQACPDDPP